VDFSVVAFVYTGRKAWKGETNMPYIKSFLACAASLVLLLPLRAEAADVYSVIYSDASYYNGNPVECVPVLEKEARGWI